MAAHRTAAIAALSPPSCGVTGSVALPELPARASRYVAAGAIRRCTLQDCGSKSFHTTHSSLIRYGREIRRPELARRRKESGWIDGFKMERSLRRLRARSVKVLALGENGREKDLGPDSEGLGPSLTDRLRQRLNPNPSTNPASTSYSSEPASQADQNIYEPTENMLHEEHSQEDGSARELEGGDYESSRRRQYRADVESGARGIANVLRAAGNTVSWGVSTTGRGLSAIQSGVQNRWRRARPPPKLDPDKDPDSMGDSDSETEWDGSQPEALPAPGATPAIVESEAYARQQEGASTSDSGRPGTEDSWEEPWETIKRWWNNPAFFRFRVSLSMANLTMALPAFIARASKLYPTFVTLLTGQLSLPIMAPLLFGGGIAFKAIMSNLGFVLPRLAIAGGVLWILWATNYAMQEAIAHLRNNGAIDRRISNVLVLTVELVASTIGLVTILSSVGVKISSLLLPGFAAVALAGKDVWHNYFAGFFLFAAQPFRPGDSVALLCGASASPVTPTSAVPPGWFEGVCESVDLRYTVLRNGRQRLLVPNAHFVNREFLVTDAGPVVTRPTPKVRSDAARGAKNGRANSPPGGTNGPPGMPAPKLTRNGQEKSRSGFIPTIFKKNGGPGPMPSGPGVVLPRGK